MSKTIYEKLTINVCKILCDDGHGTGFLISNKLILTAFHVVNNSEKLTVKFNNGYETNAILHELITDEDKTLDIAVLKLKQCVDFCEDIPLTDVTIKHNKKWISRGYPQFNTNLGENMLENQVNIVHEQHDLFMMNDIRLDFNHKLDSYQGLSGSPLLIDNLIVGIIKDELLEQGKAKELRGLSIKYFKDLLEKIGIEIVENKLKDLDNKKDLLSVKRWNKLDKSKDIRNLKDKIISVCINITNRKINNYIRKAVLSKEEQNMYDHRDISAVKYIIFEKCQDRLIDYYETNKDKKELSLQEIEDFLVKYVDDAKDIINDKRKVNNYPIFPDDFVTKLILDLIDECFLSFDEEGIYYE